MSSTTDWPIQPAITPPPGHIPNPNDPDKLWKYNVLTISVCLFITTVPFLLRCYTRLFVKRQWILEDWMVCLSWLGFVGYCAIMSATINKHGGEHAWNLTKEQFVGVSYWFNITSIEYAPVLCITKLSVLMLYRRVFVPRRWSSFDLILRFLEVILIGFYLATTIVKIWECLPRERIWNKKIPGQCIDVSMLLNTSGLFNFITDLLILLVPVKAVWNLNMRKKSKLQVVAVFTVGLVGPVFSLVGFIVRLKISANKDSTYRQPEILLWAAAEVSTGIMCVCLPPLSALLQHRQRGPTASIINGAGNSYGSALNSRRKTMAQGRSVLASGEYYELDEDRVRLPDQSVSTKIQGGRTMSVSSDRIGENVTYLRGDGSSGELHAKCQGSYITKTVRLEQSIV